MKAIEVSGLRFHTRAHFWQQPRTILRDVSFAVESGEIFGFLGPNGAGKTTTIKALLGLLTPTAGSLRLLGDTPSSLRIRQRVGFMPERSYFPEHLTAYEMVRQHALLAGLGYRESRQRAAELLNKVGLSGNEHRAMGKYSKGMVQRAGLAQALVGNPDLVILDEPMSGLDPLGRRDVRELMLELGKQGKTVFFSTHILPDVELLCDRVAILQDGRMQSIGSLEDLLTERLGRVEVLVPGNTVTDELQHSLGETLLRIHPQGNHLRIEVRTLDAANRVVDMLRQRDVAILGLHTHRPSLEDIFLQSGNPTRTIE